MCALWVTGARDRLDFKLFTFSVHLRAVLTLESLTLYVVALSSPVYCSVTFRILCVSPLNHFLLVSRMHVYVCNGDARLHLVNSESISVSV